MYMCDTKSLKRDGANMSPREAKEFSTRVQSRNVRLVDRVIEDANSR